MSFAKWTSELEMYLDNAKTTEAVSSPFATHLFHMTLADPGFWCQLGTFVVAGVVFRRMGFGDGPHNSWYLDVSTFVAGFYLRVALAKHLSVYLPREEAGSAIGYANANFPTRMVIVPFTSTFVPLLYGYPTASVENITACWVQHYIALVASYWSLEPVVVDKHVDLRARPYADAARSVENLKVRVAALGSFTDVSTESFTQAGSARGTTVPEPEVDREKEQYISRLPRNSPDYGEQEYYQDALTTNPLRFGVASKDAMIAAQNRALAYRRDNPHFVPDPEQRPMRRSLIT